MINKKALSGWAWVLIVLVLILIGVGLYYWISGGSVGSLGGSSIPQPPALPSG